MGTQVKFRHLRENENMAKKLKTEKSSILQNFRTAFDEAVKKMSFKLGLRQVHLGLKEEKIRWPSVGSNFQAFRNFLRFQKQTIQLLWSHQKPRKIASQ